MTLDNRIINLDINRNNIFNLKSKQHDTDGARSFTFRLLKDSVPFSLDGLYVKVGGKKPDNTDIFNDCKIKDAKKGLVEVELTTQMQVESGLLNLELIILKDNVRLSTIPFEVQVIKSAMDFKKVESSSEFRALQEALWKTDNVYTKQEVDSKTWAMSNMGQDVKEAMTGGSVAVVGENAVDTINVRDKAITNSKMSYINANHEIIQWDEYFKIEILSPEGIGYKKPCIIKIIPNLYIYTVTDKLINITNDTHPNLPIGGVLEDGEFTFTLRHLDILVYDVETNSILRINSNSNTYGLKANQFLLASCHSGEVKSGILKNIYDTIRLNNNKYLNAKTESYAYLLDDWFDIKATKAGIALYFKKIAIRNNLNLDFEFDYFKKKFPEQIINIEDYEYFLLKKDYSLVVNLDTKEIEIVYYTSIKNNMYNLLTIVSTGSDNYVRSGALYDQYLNFFISKSDKKIEDLNKKIETSTKKLPNYWQEYLNSKIEEIKKYQAENGGWNNTCFGFVTDLHYPNNSGNSGLILEEVLNKCDIENFFCGGDLINNDQYYTKEKAIESIETFRDKYRKIQDKMLVSLGNHDDNSITNDFNRTIIDEQMYSYLFRYNNEEKFKKGRTGEYFYTDDTFNNIRYITLNCIDIPYIDVDGHPKYTGQHNYWFREEQIKWFGNIALNVPDNTWSVVVCTHVPLVKGMVGEDYLPGNGEHILGILEAFKNKTSYNAINTTNQDFLVNAKFDFTNKGGEVICCIYGHVHADNIKIVNGIVHVTTLNDSLNVWDTQPSKQRGTITEQALDVFSINKNTKKVKIFRIGAGEDREFNY